MTYYIVQDKTSKKFADGYYGWDGNIHSDCQIFAEEDLPYYENDRMDFIKLGDERPSIAKVWELLEERRNRKGFSTNKPLTEGVMRQQPKTNTGKKPIKPPPSQKGKGYE